MDFKNLYINEQFKNNIFNKDVSYDLISNIYFDKKNRKIFNYAFFIFLFLFMYSILLILLTFWIMSLINPYLTIAALCLNLFSLIVMSLYGFIFTPKKNKEYKHNLRFDNILDFYFLLKKQIIQKKIDNNEIDLINEHLFNLNKTKKIIFTKENNLNTKKINKENIKIYNKKKFILFYRLILAMIMIIIMTPFVMTITNVISTIRLYDKF